MQPMPAFLQSKSFTALAQIEQETQLTSIFLVVEPSKVPYLKAGYILTLYSGP